MSGIFYLSGNQTPEPAFWKPALFFKHDFFFCGFVFLFLLVSLLNVRFRVKYI